MSAAERFVLPLLVAVSAYGLALSRGSLLLLDGDTYWHIATGNRILQHVAVPHRDPFSFTVAGAPWVDHEWLGEVLMALAYDTAGWSGLVLLTALALASALGLLCRALGRWLPPLPSFLLTLLGYLTVLSTLLCRPHMLALPLLVVWGAGLARARAESRAPRFALVALMALWANLHGSFLFGLVWSCRWLPRRCWPHPASAAARPWRGADSCLPAWSPAALRRTCCRGCCIRCT